MKALIPFLPAAGFVTAKTMTTSAFSPEVMTCLGPLRSHSGAKGLRRSRAKSRAITGIITCSCERIIVPPPSRRSPAPGPLPRQSPTIIIEEATAILAAEPGDDAAHSGDAFRDAQGRAGTAHIGADPSRMEDRGDELGRVERERAPDRVEGGLRGT